MIITRFAPSPTGYLHIGGARTALFNMLHTKRRNGRFMLRIEDTDKVRSTPEAVRAILDGLEWLGINWDGEVVYQSARSERHREVAEQMVKMGKAYYCYLQPEEIAEMKRQNSYAKIASPWRDSDRRTPEGLRPCIRLKVAVDIDSAYSYTDLVQGQITVSNNELDDMVLLRADGTPTYMLAVVVDDYDMGVNCIIRGDDHLTNTFRQIQIYRNMGWPIPEHAHIPLIHGSDGSKLSKRHGAVGLSTYRDLGYLPEAMVNYLLLLGWGGDGKTDIIDLEQAIEQFDIKNVSKGPARFDQPKLDHINSAYIKKCDNDRLIRDICEIIPKKLINITDTLANTPINNSINLIDLISSEKINILQQRLATGLGYLKPRAKTLQELSELAFLYLYSKNSVQISINPEDSQAINSILADHTKMSQIQAIYNSLQNLDDWTVAGIKSWGGEFVISQGIDNKTLIQVLRAIIIGTFVSPGVYEFMSVIGKQESLDRMKKFL